MSSRESDIRFVGDMKTEGDEIPCNIFPIKSDRWRWSAASYHKHRTPRRLLIDSPSHRRIIPHHPQIPFPRLNSNRPPRSLHMLRKRIHIPRSKSHRNLIPHILRIVHQVLSFSRVDTDDTEHQLAGHSEGYGLAILFQDGLWQT